MNNEATNAYISVSPFNTVFKNQHSGRTKLKHLQGCPVVCGLNGLLATATLKEF